MASISENAEALASQLKKAKIVNGNRRKFVSRKFQQVVESFRKKGSGDDSSGEEEENEEDESDPELEVPEVIGVSLNLSKKKLRSFHENLLDRIHKVQYLYLEGNKLTALPEKFFQSLFVLKWLDLRNNSLTSLPTIGLKHHPYLEIILLQGNQIRNLPVELSTISSLRGLQITGNPITNVPYEVIAEGFQAIMKHLEKLYQQDEILFPVSNTVVVKPSTSKDNSEEVSPAKRSEPADSENRKWDLEKLSQWRHFLRKKTDNPKAPIVQYNLSKMHQKLISQQPKISVSVRAQPKTPTKPQPFRCGIYNKNRHKSMANARHYLKMRKTALGYKKKPVTVTTILEKARSEAHRAQLRETLEKQAKKIQRLRDKEVLKNWRDHAKITSQQLKYLDNYQQYPSKDFANKTPFDVDPEFLNMLNRIDLYRSLRDYDNRSKRKKMMKAKFTAQDLEKQMSEIIKKLQELDTNEDESKIESPRAKHSHMCNKMRKIMDIQKTLKSLQKLNSTMGGVTKPKPREQALN